jgi:transposase
VIRLGELVMILDLHRQGLSVSAIARRVGIDRKTARKYIERGLEPPSYGLALEEDCDAEEELQAGRDCRQAAAG